MWHILFYGYNLYIGDVIMVFQRIKKYVKHFLPYGLIMLHRRKAQRKADAASFEMRKKRWEKEIEIRNYFLKLDYNEQDHEVAEIIDFFKKHNFSIFPYEFARKYHPEDVDVFYDELHKTWYIIHEGKRLYFPDGWSIEQIQAYYNGLCIEQDKDSPHLYETEEFTVKSGDVIADIGAAEGIWALSNVEKASKIYLFECEPKWVNALQKTFEPWKEKVVIVNKYVSDVSDDKNITLDSYFGGQEINFIKADIEGMELKMLKGMSEIFHRNNELKLMLCAYHKAGDAVELKEFLEQNGFAAEFSKGYMLFIYDNDLREPYIRRGLIRAKK
jgi:hypothetical protein